MTTFNYADMVATADSLIEEFGRPVSFFKTSVTPNDSAKPWRTEQTSTDEQIDGIMASIVPYMSEDDKDSVRYGTKMVIVSASQFPDDDAEDFDGLIEADGARWHLHDCEIVNPGGTRVLYIFKAEQ